MSDGLVDWHRGVAADAFFSGHTPPIVETDFSHDDISAEEPNFCDNPPGFQNTELLPHNSSLARVYARQAQYAQKFSTAVYPSAALRSTKSEEQTVDEAIDRVQEILKAAELEFDSNYLRKNLSRCNGVYYRKARTFYRHFHHQRIFYGLKSLHEGRLYGVAMESYFKRKHKLNKVALLIDRGRIESRGENFKEVVRRGILRLKALKNIAENEIYNDLRTDRFTEEYARLYVAMRREILTDEDCLRELENICWRSFTFFPIAAVNLMDFFYKLCEKLFGNETYDYRNLFAGFYRSCHTSIPRNKRHKHAVFQSFFYKAREAGEDAYYWGVLRNFANCQKVARHMYEGDETTLKKILILMHALATIVLNLINVSGKSPDGKRITICRMEGSKLIGKRGSAAHIKKNCPNEVQYLYHNPVVCASLGGHTHFVGRKITIYKDIPIYRIFSGFFLEDDVLGRTLQSGISIFNEGLSFFYIGNLRGKTKKHPVVVRYDESYNELFHFPKATHRLGPDGNKVFTPHGSLEYLKTCRLADKISEKMRLPKSIDELPPEQCATIVNSLNCVLKKLPPDMTTDPQIGEACQVLLSFAKGKCEKLPSGATADGSFGTIG